MNPNATELAANLPDTIKIIGYGRHKYTGQLRVSLTGEKTEVSNLIQENSYKAEVMDASLFDNDNVIAYVDVRAD